MPTIIRSGCCSQCGRPAIKPNQNLAKQLYCSWDCLLNGERPHIHVDRTSGRLTTCQAMSITAQIYVNTLCSLGLGFSYMALADRYRKAQAYCAKRNAQHQQAARGQSCEPV